MIAAPFINLAKTKNERQLLSDQASFYNKMIGIYENRIRIYEVSEFRISVFNQFGLDALNSLPSFDDMVADEKDLTPENYLHSEINF